MQGVFRRGLQLEALKEFILSQGASKNVTLQEWEKLWSINKRIIDPVCPRCPARPSPTPCMPSCISMALTEHHLLEKSPAAACMRTQT